MATQGASGSQVAAVEVDPAIAAWWAAQQATAGTAPALPTTFDVTVSPSEPLQAAIDRCLEGGSILLLPGAYEGGVVLSTKVHLFGRGEATLRRAGGEGPVITSTAPTATLDGLVVRLGPHAEGEVGHFGILITTGSLLVRHCDVSSKSRSNICVRGASASPIILACKVHDSSRAGIVFEEGGKGRVEGCDIAGNAIFGVSIDGPESLLNVICDNGNRFSGNKGADMGGDWGGDAPAVGSATPPEEPLVTAPSDLRLLKELECAVCLRTMIRPLTICVKGHSACPECFEQLNQLNPRRCPSCREILLSQPIPILSLEGLAQDLLVPCPYATADGCPLNALRYADAAAHANKCDWRKVCKRV